MLFTVISPIALGDDDYSGSPVAAEGGGTGNDDGVGIQVYVEDGGRGDGMTVEVAVNGTVAAVEMASLAMGVFVIL